MTLRIAIIDDEKTIRDLYFEYVSEWGRINDKILEIICFESAEEFLFKYEDSQVFDYILLDIEMKSISGVDLAKKLRSINDDVIIIFISGYSEYIGYGYDVDAIHFLIKPIDKLRLFDVLNKAYQKTEKMDKSIMVKTEGRQVRIYLNEIYIVENDKNYLNIQTLNKSYKVRMTMKKMEDSLDDRFYRVSRSEIINLEFISSFDTEKVCMENDSIVYLPRGTFEGLNRKIINYF